MGGTYRRQQHRGHPMVIIPKTADLHAKVVATIQAGRLVAEAWDQADLDVGTDLRAVRQFIAELAAGEVFNSALDAGLQSIPNHVLAHFGRHLPAYVEILQRGSTDDYRLEDPAHDAIRVLWENLHGFRWIRQIVLDEIHAEQLIGKLRRTTR